MNPVRKQLHDILYKGTGSEIFLAVRARELHRTIAANAERVNKAGYGELFAAFQNAAIGELTLGVAKLFERPNGRHATRSLPSAIALLSAHSAELIPIEPINALRDLSRIGVDVSALRHLSGADYTTCLASRLASACPGPSLILEADRPRGLDALRASRNKTIAHNEAVDRATLPSISWEDVENLILFAKHTHAALAMAYFGSVWTNDNGTFLPDGKARLASEQLARLIATIDVDVARIVNGRTHRFQPDRRHQ